MSPSPSRVFYVLRRNLVSFIVPAVVVWAIYADYKNTKNYKIENLSKPTTSEK